MVAVSLLQETPDSIRIIEMLWHYVTLAPDTNVPTCYLRQEIIPSQTWTLVKSTLLMSANICVIWLLFCRTARAACAR